MSERERWVVYPLLLLALGMALETRIDPPDQIHCQKLHCDELIVAESLQGPKASASFKGLAILRDNHTPLVTMGAFASPGDTASSNMDGGIGIIGREGKVVVALGTESDGHYGAVTTMISGGNGQTRLASDEFGGSLILHDEEQQRVIRLGHDKHLSGLAAGTTNNRLSTTKWFLPIPRSELPVPPKPADTGTSPNATAPSSDE
jgi:hypothetical protein